jgi:hypothetical protein
MKSLSTIAALAYMGLCVAAGSPARAADTVRIEDEPARNPYMDQTVVNGCINQCTSVFSAVPSSKTLRITYISCYFLLSVPNGVGLLTLGYGQQYAIWIPLIAQPGTDSGYVQVASAEVNFYVKGGSVPNINLLTFPSDYQYGTCTITGYTV